MSRSIIYLLLITLIVFIGCDPKQESDCGRVCFELSDQEFSAQNTYQIALGDVDGDGNLDAVLANMQEVYEETMNRGMIKRIK